MKVTPFASRLLPLSNVQAVWMLLIFALIAWFISFNYRASWELADKDLMLFTGFLAAIIGLGYSVILDRGTVDVIEEWHDSCIFDATPLEMGKIKRKLLRIEKWITLVITVLVVSVIAIGYTRVYSNQMEFREFIVASLVFSILIGLRLSRLVTYGLMGWTLRAQKVQFYIVIEHSDGAGGLAKIGSFYLFQTSVLAVPMLWLVYWLWKIPSFSEYTYWTEPFYTLIAVGSLIFFLAFWVPMTAFSRLMLDRKRSHVIPEIARARKELLKLVDAKSPTAADLARRQELINYVQALTSIPNWPVSPRTVGGFVVVLVVPLIFVFIEYWISSM